MPRRKAPGPGGLGAFGLGRMRAWPQRGLSATGDALATHWICFCRWATSGRFARESLPPSFRCPNHAGRPRGQAPTAGAPDALAQRAAVLAHERLSIKPKPLLSQLQTALTASITIASPPNSQRAAWRARRQPARLAAAASAQAARPQASSVAPGWPFARRDGPFSAQLTHGIGQMAYAQWRSFGLRASVGAYIVTGRNRARCPVGHAVRGCPHENPYRR